MINGLKLCSEKYLIYLSVINKAIPTIFASGVFFLQFMTLLYFNGNRKSWDTFWYFGISVIRNLVIPECDKSTKSYKVVSETGNYQLSNTGKYEILSGIPLCHQYFLVFHLGNVEIPESLPRIPENLSRYQKTISWNTSISLKNTGKYVWKYWYFIRNTRNTSFWYHKMWYFWWQR